MSEAKKRSITLDGHFLKADIYEYASGEQRLDVALEIFRCSPRILIQIRLKNIQPTLPEYFSDEIPGS